MREIEYRAWNVKEKIMCYDNEDNSSSYWDGVKSSFIGLVNCNFQYYSNNNTYIFMQWTGLYDKNKKKIYEGDIVKYKNSIESGIFEIKYDNCEFYADWKESNNFMENTTSMKYLQCSNELEVIGNIYENEN